MVVPQQYMVMPGGAAVQLPPGHLPAGHPAAGHMAGHPLLHHHHQQQIAAAQAAASHASGAPVITTSGATSASAPASQLGGLGVVSIGGLPPHMAGVGTPMVSMAGAMAAAGLHQALPAGIPSPYAGLTPLTAASQLPPGFLAQQQQQQQQQLSQPPPQHASPQLQQLSQLHQTSPSPHQLMGAGQDMIKKEEEKR